LPTIESMGILFFMILSYPITARDSRGFPRGNISPSSPDGGREIAYILQGSGGVRQGEGGGPNILFALFSVGR
jgi:hypothetical protein